MSTTQIQFRSRRVITTALSISLFITLFLFFIDEGYYSFKWMQNAGNWIVFFIYIILLFTGQVIVNALLFRKNTTSSINIFKHIFGVAVGFLFIYALFGPWKIH